MYEYKEASVFVTSEISEIEEDGLVLLYSKLLKI